MQQVHSLGRTLEHTHTIHGTIVYLPTWMVDFNGKCREMYQTWVVGGFICFYVHPLFGEDSHFDSYFSNGLRPQTRKLIIVIYSPYQLMVTEFRLQSTGTELHPITAVHTLL